jgi:hypothetical protein
MDRIRPMASVLRAWWPAEQGCTGLLARPTREVGPRDARPRARHVQRSGHARGRRFGAASAVGVEVQAWQGLRGKRHDEEDQTLGKEARCRLT